MTSIQKGAACILNNVGMAFGVKLIAQYEGTGNKIYYFKILKGHDKEIYYNIIGLIGRYISPYYRSGIQCICHKCEKFFVS